MTGKKAVEYLTQAGMNVSARYREEWIEFCSVMARVASSGLKAKTDYKECRVTLNDAILEATVVRNSEWRCSWSFDIYAENTNMEFLNHINETYQAAINFAVNDNNTVAANVLQSQSEYHFFQIKTNKNSAILRATATSAPFFGPGAKCDLTLKGKVRRLDV